MENKIDLGVYDEFEFLQSVDIFTSLRWRRMYYGVGEFELHVSDTKENIALFKEGRHINRKDRNETGVIEDYYISDGDLKVVGRFMTKVLEDNIINEVHTGHMSHQDAIRYWVLNYVAPENSGLILGSTVEQENQIDFTTSYRNVLSNTQKFLKACECGHNIKKDFTNEQYRYDIYQGVNRSAEQSIVSKVIFSDGFENLSNPQYSKVTSKYKNYATIIGAGEGSLREQVIVDRREETEKKKEIFVDGSQISYEGLTVAKYRAALKESAEMKLDECKMIEEFTGDIIEIPNFEYLVDWDLGDVVTIEKTQWGKSKEQRITEVEEIYEGGFAQVIPVLGDALPEIIELEDLL